jgi:BirA family biotin operon repressor/biotin-[acetyl-CoA-carboxylase] ligase
LSAAAAERARLLDALGPAARRLASLDCVAEIDSTNAELLRRGGGQAVPAVLIADAQHAGRGRFGRRWHSPRGANLYLSMACVLPRACAGFSLAMGIAGAEALHALGHAEVRLKWPNDLQARGAKLGGVLVELAGERAVVGLGLNLRMPAADAAPIDQPWIDLARLGDEAPRESIAARVISHWLDAIDAFDAHGLAPFLARWDALDALAGREVRVIAGAEEFTGRAGGIAPDGGLRVRLADGERVFHSAEVSLRAA